MFHALFTTMVKSKKTTAQKEAIQNETTDPQTKSAQSAATDEEYLPLTGGTISGNLTVKGGAPANSNALRIIAGRLEIAGGINVCQPNVNTIPLLTIPQNLPREIVIGTDTGGYLTNDLCNLRVNGALNVKGAINGINLTEFNPNSTTAGATYIVTAQTAISGTKTLANNVTLVFAGGCLTGSGTLTGNNTRIEAGLNQIFDPALTFQGTWVTPEIYPEWFGDTNISSEEKQITRTDHKGASVKITVLYPGDCTAMIQAAINLARVTQNHNKADVKGGKVVCRHCHKYGISKPIKIPRGVSFDGGNSDFIPYYTYVNSSNPCVVSFTLDSDSLKFMFKINIKTEGTTTSANEATGKVQWETYSNIKIANFFAVKDTSHPYFFGENFSQALVPGLKGIFNGCGHCSYENISAFGLWQTFRRVTDYTDMLSLRNIVSGWSKKGSGQEDYYQIDTGSTGDNLLIDNITLYGYHSNSDVHSKKHLRIYGCGGGVVNRVINGSVYIANSRALVVQGVHQEFGNFTIENSQVEINGVWHMKKLGQHAFIIKKRTGYQDHRIVSLKNIVVSYNHGNIKDEDETNVLANYYGNTPQYDIYLEDASEIVTIENVVRCNNRGDVETSSLYGIRVNHAGFMENPAKNSLQSTIVGNESANDSQTILNNFIAYQHKSFPSILTTESYGSVNGIFAAYVNKPTSLNSGTYTYKAAILYNKARRLGRELSGVISLDIPQSTNPNKMTQMALLGDIYIGAMIRLYKWTGTSTTPPSNVDYIDIPVCSARNLFFDLGTVTMFGESWISGSYNNVKLLDCDRYQETGDNVNVVCDAKPTFGSWQAGDTVTIKNGDRWYYDGSTWKK